MMKLAVANGGYEWIKARAQTACGNTEWLLRFGANGCPPAACKARYAPAATEVFAFVKRYEGLLAFPVLGAKAIALGGFAVDTTSPNRANSSKISRAGLGANGCPAIGRPASLRLRANGCDMGRLHPVTT